jgi:NADP-dependent 3-hydroxy acid dehydrogenase YdfG
MSYKDQTSVVTGASSGIGRAIALALSNTGMSLALVGREPQRLAEVSAAAARTAARVKTYQADLEVDEDIRRVSLEVTRDFGSLDVLIHSAGIFRMGPIAEAPVSDLDSLYRTNVRAPYALTKALLPMISARRGQIVFINSSAGLTARANVAAYAATKHALKAIADSLRAEINAVGVRVITVYPGRTATPQQAQIHDLEGKLYEPGRLLQPEDVANAVLNALAMPRTAEVTDISIRPMRKT